jgi:hypothetical protein
MVTESDFTRKAATYLIGNAERLANASSDQQTKQKLVEELAQALTEAYQEGFESGLRQRRIIDEFFAPKWPYSQ